MHLLLAGMWFVVATLFLVWSYTKPDDPNHQVFGSGISIGWLALLMGGYNLVRWWANRQYRRMRQQPYVNPLFERRHAEPNEELWREHDEKGLHD